MYIYLYIIQKLLYIIISPVISGWGGAVFTFPSTWWCLVPVLATHLGGVIGAWLYYLAIELHWTKQDHLQQEEEEEEGEADPLPVKRDLEAAARGENGGMFNGVGGGPPPPLLTSSTENIGLREDLKFRMNK